MNRPGTCTATDNAPTTNNSSSSSLTTHYTTPQRAAGFSTTPWTATSAHKQLHVDNPLASMLPQQQLTLNMACAGTVVRQLPCFCIGIVAASALLHPALIIHVCDTRRVPQGLPQMWEAIDILSHMATITKVR